MQCGEKEKKKERRKEGEKYIDVSFTVTRHKIENV
jgi:hypothetical protein